MKKFSLAIGAALSLAACSGCSWFSSVDKPSPADSGSVFQQFAEPPLVYENMALFTCQMNFYDRILCCGYMAEDQSVCSMLCDIPGEENWVGGNKINCATGEPWVDTTQL